VRSLALAGAVLLAACGELGAAEPPARVPERLFRHCLETLEAADKEDQSHDLRWHCPDLAARLTPLVARGDLGAFRIEEAGIRGLRDVQAFEGTYAEQLSLPEGVALDHAGLDELLSDVLIDNREEDSWWDRFVRWMQEHLRDSDTGDYRWLADWLDNLKLPDWVGELLLKGSIVLIVLLAILVVGNELRVAGVFRRSWRKRRPDTVDSGEVRAEALRPRSLQELGGLPPKQLAAAALAVVVDALAERDWVTADSSFTNGELVGQLSRRHAVLTEPFARLVRGVERIVYGDRAPESTERSELLGNADAILTQARAPGGREAKG
jgi:hypothetical protein